MNSKMPLQVQRTVLHAKAMAALTPEEPAAGEYDDTLRQALALSTGEEIAHQLSSLGEMHRALLPCEIPQPKGWRVAAHYAASVWPGGDYYDVRQYSDGGLLLFMGDANDQGAASTALAILVRSVLHTCPLSSGVNRLPYCPISAPSAQRPDLLLEHLNFVLAENSQASQSMSAVCGVLDTTNGCFEFANAGHPFPRLWRAANRSLEILHDGYRPALGAVRHPDYQVHSVTLEPGDLLVLYNDSVTASLNAGSQRFGWGLLDEALHAAAPHGAEAVKSAVIDRLSHSLAGRSHADEATLLIVEKLRSQEE